MRWIEVMLALALAGLACAPGQIVRPGPPQAAGATGATPSSGLIPRVHHFVVVLDAAHGGNDDGARFGKNILEKNLTLNFAERLQSLLRQQGIAVTMTRTADINLPALNRAEIANHAQAAACLVIHATATGSGVHLFTSSISPVNENGLVPWETAQAAYVTDSLKLQAELDASLVHAAIPVTMGRASVVPMDNFACPTVAVELAPLAPGNTTQGRAITDERYQNTVAGALAAAIGSWRTDRKEP